jgi:hypothetical protein
MQKVNPFTLPRPVREVVTREFSADGVTVTIAFRRPDAADMNRAAETARRRVQEFITGDPEMGRGPADFFDGIKVSESLLLLCAAAEEMQPPEARLYTDIEFVMLLDRLPTDGPRIAAFVREMQIDWRVRQGESPGATTGSPSVERSGSPELIQRSSPEPTSSSEASTPDWVGLSNSSTPAIPVPT